MACHDCDTNNLGNLNLGQVQAITGKPLLSQNVVLPKDNSTGFEGNVQRYVFVPKNLRLQYEFQQS